MINPTSALAQVGSECCVWPFSSRRPPMINKHARMKILLYGLATVVAAGCASPFNSLQRAGPANTPSPISIEQRVILIGDAGTAKAAGVLQVMADSVRNIA